MDGEYICWVPMPALPIPFETPKTVSGRWFQPNPPSSIEACQLIESKRLSSFCAPHAKIWKLPSIPHDILLREPAYSFFDGSGFTDLYIIFIRQLTSLCHARGGIVGEL